MSPFYLGGVPILIFKWRGWLIAPYGICLLLFGKPTLPSFIIGLLVACLGEAVRIWGVGYAGKTTRKSTLDAPVLVTAGPYAYVRHPIYIGNTLMGLGGLIMAIGDASIFLTLFLVTLFLVLYGFVYNTLMSLEEEFLEQQFGSAYVHYKKAVPRFPPALKPYPRPQGQFDSSTILSAEIYTLIPFLILVILMGFKIR